MSRSHDRQKKLIGANDNHLFGSPDDDSVGNVAGIDQGTPKVGEDILDWAAGMDAAVGSMGIDAFVFDSILNVDSKTIAEFQFGDVIDQSGIDARAPIGDDQSFELIFDAPVFTPAGFLKFHQVSDDGKGNGGELINQNKISDEDAADFHITITNRSNSNASDFNDI